MAFLDLLDAGNKKHNVPQDSQVLVTSSIAGFSRFVASSFAYSTSKAAATHLVKMLSTTFAQLSFRIRVNLIAPGLYPSEMTEPSISKLDRHGGVEGHEGAHEGAHAMPLDRSPAGRTGSEEDFAGTVLYMASRAGAYLNGETLVTVRRGLSSFQLEHMTDIVCAGRRSVSAASRRILVFQSARGDRNRNDTSRSFLSVECPSATEFMARTSYTNDIPMSHEVAPVTCTVM